jgi:hypothetical protein
MYSNCFPAPLNDPRSTSCSTGGDVIITPATPTSPAYISVNGSTPVALPDSDNQELVLSGASLAITSGNSVDLAALPLSLSFNELTGSLTVGGTTVNLSGLSNEERLTYDPATNTLILKGSDGSNLSSIALQDKDAQTLSFNVTSYVLTISNGNTVTIPKPSADPAIAALIAQHALPDTAVQNANGTTTLTIGGETVILPAPNPAISDTQQLTIAGNVISLQRGGTVDISSAPAVQNPTLSYDTTTGILKVNGSAVTIPETVLVATDSSTVDFVSGGASGHTLTATVKVSATAPNLLTAVSDGLRVAPPTIVVTPATNTTPATLSIGGGTPVSLPGDNDKQTLTLTGVNLAISSGNTVDLAPAIVAAQTPLVVTDSTSINFTTSGTAGHALTGSVIVDPATTNKLSAGATGLLVPPAVSTYNAATNTITVDGTSIVLTDKDSQTLTLTGSTLQISGGNSVTLPVTVHANSWTQAVGLAESVNGVTSNINIPAGTLTQVLGYSSTGTPVYTPVATLIPATTNTQAWTQASGLVDTVNGISATTAIPAGTLTQVLGYSSTGAPVYTPVATLIPATIHANAWTQAGGLAESVNGVASNIAIPAGTLTQVLGYSSTGAPVYTPVTTLIPATIHANAWTQAGGLAESVNGVASNIAIPAGTLTQVLGYSSTGAPVYTPVTTLIPATTNTQAWTQAGGLVDTVNGVAATTAIPSGTVTQVLGYSSTGAPVYTPVATLIPATTNTQAWTQAGGLVDTVNGVAATTAIPSGTIANILGYSSTGAPVYQSLAAATTHVNAWTQAGGLAESVNGVASNIAIPTGTVAQVLGYNATGAPVYQAIAPVTQIVETAVDVAAATTLTSTSTTVGLVTTRTVQTLALVSAAATVTLPAPASVPVGVEIDVKKTGAGAYAITVAGGGGTVDGAATYVFAGTTALQSRSFRTNGTNWYVV